MSDNSEMYPKLSKDCYWEFRPSDDGYYYYVQTDDLDYHITPNGVSVCRENGTSTILDFVPIDSFGEIKQLTDDQLCFIIKLPIEGETHTKEEMDRFYQQFLSENN